MPHQPSHPPQRRGFRISASLTVGSLLAILIAFLVPWRPASGPQRLLAADPLPKPTNISCQGFERDTVLVYWTDTATDETNYRIERSVDGGDFTEVATVSPDSNGNYGPYRDTSVDVTQDLRYQVRSYRSSDDTFSPYTDEVCSNPRIAETANYRIFYHVDGTGDACPTPHGKPDCLANDSANGENIYITRLKQALEGSAAGMTRIGFDESPTDQIGGLDKVPIHIGNGGGATAYLSGGGIWMRVATEDVLERSFDLETRVGVATPWTVPTHEMQHLTQYQYGLPLNDPARNWVYEGHANLVMDKVCVGDDRDTCEDFDDNTTDPFGYVPWTNNYLGFTNRPVLEASYAAVHLWAYLSEHYGTANLDDPVESGMNILPEFWREARANPDRDGVAVLNSTLATLGHSETFRDVWKDFAVASYAKNLTGDNVPEKYQYVDMTQPGGSYNLPTRALSRNLALGEQAVDSDETVTAWGAQYYEVRPAADVPIISIEFTQDLSVPLYYTVLGIDADENITYEHNVEANNLELSLLNEDYARVVVVVAGLESLANYRYSFNGTQPTLTIRQPASGSRVRVGDPAAPGKFLTVVEIVAPDGTPFPNVDLENFTFRVGSAEVPTARILTQASVQNQQWFLLRAPDQTSTGNYDLTVEYGAALSATNSNAVSYTERDDTDNVLILDRSGSMDDFGITKLEAAQAAARIYVDSWTTGDQIALVQFNDSATAELPLQSWSSTVRDSAIAEINALTADGGTAIGDALREGWDELLKDDGGGDPDHDWALILLSDGLETAGSESFDDLIRELDEATGKRPVVHTVAVGPDADRLRMQRLASKTGGTYHAVSVPVTTLRAGLASIDTVDNLALDLSGRYRAIATEVDGQQQFFSLVGPLGAPNSIEDVVNIPVEGSAAELVLSLSVDASSGFMNPPKLYPPGEYPFGTDIAVDQSYLSGDEHHYIWRVSNPQSGNWTLYLNAVINLQSEPGVAQVESALPDYLVQAGVRSDVTLDVYLTTPVEERSPGVPMGIVAGLTDTTPIAGATVSARVTDPEGMQRTVTLFDDGNHDDGAAGDGLYGGTFYATGRPGSYNVLVEAEGSSSVSGNFTREKLLSFFIDGVDGRDNDPPGVDPEPEPKDRDNDGLPDAWEERYGTDPDTPDADGDLDRDGWSNLKELEEGTRPDDPDTDDDGEADSTDDDPLTPAATRLDPIRVVVYPRNGEVLVRYTPFAPGATVEIYRAPDRDGPFTSIGTVDPALGEYVDPGRTNGDPYCYIAIATVGGKRTIPSDPSCTTPSVDYSPPRGIILINDGAPTTASPDVVLNLYASDTLDPELVLDADNLPRDDTATGVTEMKVSNRADLSDASWEPYATTKNWTLAQQSGLATVFVRYRDGAGNESETYPATIQFGADTSGRTLYLPLIRR
jgi:Mg-chelatase subunit ChlD